MVVASEYNGRGDLATGYGIVECTGNTCAPFTVGIQDACLRADNKIVGSGFFDPVNVVEQLSVDLFRRFTQNFFQNLSCDLIGAFQVGRIAGCADPAEWAEAIVEESGSHDVLYVGGVAEASVRECYVGTGTR